jgi:cell division protein FtsL
MSNFMKWVTHGIKRGRFELDRQGALYLFTSVALLTLVAALYLMLVSRTAARGRHIQQLQVEIAQLDREIEQLEVDIAREAAVSRLQERAKGLGFEPAVQVEYLSLAPQQ